LLGTGGLITAYKEAASAALNDAVVIEKNVEINCEIHFPYPSMNDIMKLMKDYGTSIMSQEFEIECMLRCSVPVRVEKQLFDQLNKIDEVRIIFL